MEKPCLTDTQDTASTWDFWVEAIEQPDAYKWVNGLNGASVALNRILEHGFPPDEMEQWLLDWPTELGMARFWRVGGTAGILPPGTAGTARVAAD